MALQYIVWCKFKANGKTYLPYQEIDKNEYDALLSYQDRVNLNPKYKPTVVVENTKPVKKSEVLDRVTLSKEYEELFGKKPHHLKSTESIQKDIDEKLQN